MAGEQYDTWGSLPPIDMKSRRLSINNERRYERLVILKFLNHLPEHVSDLKARSRQCFHSLCLY